MIVFGHWMQHAYEPAYALGIRGCWFGADDCLSATSAEPFVEWCRTHSDVRFLFSFFFTQDRLYDTDGAWQRDAGNAVRWLVEHGIVAQCAGIAYDDEFWSALYGEGLTSPGRRDHWPILAGRSPAACWALRHDFATQFSARTADLRRIWGETTGTPCPPVGMSETGAVLPPEFAGQAWWGLDVYYAPWGAYYQTAEAVQALYRTAWSATRLAIMPVVGMFIEGDGRQVPAPPELQRAYRPILSYADEAAGSWGLTRTPRTWAIGLFLLRHPGQDNPVHGTGRGVLDGMAPVYLDAVRALCAEARCWPAAL